MDTAERPYSQTLNRLRGAGLRPTRQRLALGRLLFDGDDRHVTAELLHEEAVKAGVSVSLATVYNTLHQFTHAGLLREVVVDSARTYFDTNTSDHHHFFHEEDAALMDISGAEISVAGLPSAPDGTDISRVDIVVRIRPSGPDA
jgi:Fur family iron response transcriptional regulator